MKARKVTQLQLYDLIDSSHREGVIDPSKLKWDVAVLVPDCSSEKNRFTRSVSQYVDDRKKKASFLLSIGLLFEALQDENYQAALIGSPVACKSARTFKFDRSNHKLWELKPNNKDRIYFYPVTDLEYPARKTIFLLMAYHKKDETTPSEAADPCEEEIKNILKSKGKIDFCEVKNGKKQ